MAIADVLQLLRDVRADLTKPDPHRVWRSDLIDEAAKAMNHGWWGTSTWANDALKRLGRPEMAAGVPADPDDLVAREVLAACGELERLRQGVVPEYESRLKIIDDLIERLGKLPESPAKQQRPVSSFFVPAAKSPEQAEQVWEAASKFAQERLGWTITNRRILRIEFEHNGKKFVAEVGKQLGDGVNEIVCVILETANAYIVCTPNRGIFGGEHYLVGKASAWLVVDFSADTGPHRQHG